MFTLNTFDDLTTNRIFLFGVNLLLSPRTGKFDLELFTSKHTIKTGEAQTPIVMLNNRRTAFNVTFTSTSIELRLNGEEAYTLRLTDRYFSLLLRSLLKAYGAFQLNATTFESDSAPGSMHLLNACMGNFRLATRRPTPLGFQLAHYSLIEQTKSISIFQSDYYSDLTFDSTCANAGSHSFFNKFSTGPRSIGSSGGDDSCYLVTRVDVLTSQKVDDYLDCECNSTSCSFKKWSNFTKSGNSLLLGSVDFVTEQQQQQQLPVTCSQDYACFNNATCLDVSLSPTQAFTCKCVGSYTGDR